MIILPLSCTCSDLKVFPKNWMSAKVSIKKDWYVYYRFYDPVFKENPTYKKGLKNLLRNFVNLCDYWLVIDNSTSTYSFIAKGKAAVETTVYNLSTWSTIKKSANEN